MQCPSCGSQRIWKAGRRGKIQRYSCRGCGYRFSESKIKFDVAGKGAPTAFDSRSKLFKDRIVSGQSSTQEFLNGLPFPFSKDVISHRLTTAGKLLNTFPYNSCKRQLRVSDGETKKLAKVETTSRQVGSTEKTEQDIKGTIISFAWHLKKNGYREITIEVATRNLKNLHKKGADLFNSESVKETIALQRNWGDAYKLNVVSSYTLFLKMQGKTWQQPIYRPVQKIPFIPTEKEIDDLIAGSGKKTAACLQLLKETGMRSGEADLLKWIDIDFERRTVRITPEKNSNPRILKISKKCVAMLKNLPKNSEKAFGDTARNSKRNCLEHTRKRLARKLNNPRLSQIHFHTLRHWKATMLYHQTKDILYVKEFLGHKKIDNTLKYIQLEQALFGRDTESFTCRVAKTPEEIKQLIEAGFEYVTEKDELIYFRKRK